VLGCAIAAAVLALIGVGNGWALILESVMTFALVFGVARVVGHFGAR
jgi:hypothetical protein